MNCEHCNNIFKTISSLNYHMSHAKYCLKIRNTINNKLICKSCDKSFSSKHWLNCHKNNCKSNINNTRDRLIVLENENNQLKIINELLERRLDDQKNNYESQISKLQDKLGDVAIKAVSRATTTNNKTQINNYIQNMQPVTEQHLKDNVQHLTIDHILKGPEGYAQYALEYPLKDRLICVDYARRKVKFKDNDGNVITDPEMSSLATKLFNSIKDKNKELILECGEKLKENFGDEVDTIVKIFDYKMKVDSSSIGDKTDFHYDFVKQVCCNSIKE
jgi:hypothetical protein